MAQLLYIDDRRADRARPGMAGDVPLPPGLRRLFPWLPVCDLPDPALADLAQGMLDPDPHSSEGDNPAMPAGYSFLGQFIAHDLSLGGGLNLSAFYGGGPRRSPRLYQPAQGQATGRSNRFRIGLTLPGAGAGQPADLPRTGTGAALIEDRRNDQSLPLAQMQLLFMRFHNAVIDRLQQDRPDLTGPSQFAEARRIVTWHYQWIALFDWAACLIGPDLIPWALEERAALLAGAPSDQHLAEVTYALLPLIQATLRDRYRYNAQLWQRGGADGTVPMRLLASYTGQGGGICGPRGGPGQGLPVIAGPDRLAALPAAAVIDWRLFFDLDGTVLPDAARRIKPCLPPVVYRPMGRPGPQGLWPLAVLRQGAALGLPSGQDAARAAGVTRLCAGDLHFGTGRRAAVSKSATPLWAYLLCEADQVHQGTSLGPLGAKLLTEALIGAMRGDAAGFLRQRQAWRPELPADLEGSFTMGDLIRFTEQADAAVRPVRCAP